VNLWKFFIWWLFLTAIGFVVIELVLWRLEERTDYQEIVRQQLQTGEVYGPRYSNVEPDYKLKLMSSMSPKMVVLGSSRAFHFSEQIVGNEGDFCNISVNASMLETMEQLKGMVQKVSDSKVEKLILCIDPWLLNPTFNKKSLMMRLHTIEKSWVQKTLPYVREIKKFHHFIRAKWKAYPMFLSDKKLPWSLLFENRKGIGIEASLYGRGFASDGHYLYPRYREVKKKSKEAYLQWLEVNRFRFSPSFHLDKNALQMLEKALDMMRKSSVEVTGLLLPFDPPFYEALRESQSHALTLREYESMIPKLFDQYDYKCLNLCDASLVGWEEGDFVDEIHFGSRLSENIWKFMIKEELFLKK
jgi:hypothetical protein